MPTFKILQNIPFLFNYLYLTLFDFFILFFIYQALWLFPLTFYRANIETVSLQLSKMPLSLMLINRGIQFEAWVFCKNNTLSEGASPSEIEKYTQNRTVHQRFKGSSRSDSNHRVNAPMGNEEILCFSLDLCWLFNIR